MNLRLDSFEQQIDPVILKRGLDYFKKRCVVDMADLGNGEYEFVVEGTDEYDVRLRVLNGEVTEYDCNCPYDMGPVCKHVVAALFYLQKDLFDGSRMTAAGKGASTVERRMSEYQQANLLLDKLPHEELKKFLHDAYSVNRKLRSAFVAKYISYLKPASKKVYDMDVKALLNAHSDKSGFIGYYEASGLGRDISEMLTDAIACKAKGDKLKALYIAEAVAEGMVQAIDYADDSTGSIGSCIYSALDLVASIAGADADGFLHAEMFEWLLGNIERKTMYGWDWHWLLVNAAIDAAETDSEMERIKSAIGEAEPKGDGWDVEYCHVTAATSRLITKTKGEKAALEYMENNLENPNFRKLLIEKALDTKDYSKAERLANDGVEKDKERSPGLADDWRRYLLKIYKAENRTEDMIRLARYFLLVGNRIDGRWEDCYRLLKSQIPGSQWREYVDGLMASISEDNHNSTAYERIEFLCVMDERWEELLGVLAQNKSFSRVERAEKYLAKEHAAELASMYEELILDYLEYNVGRAHYQYVCRYIGRIIKLGCRLKATALVDRLKNTYSKRRALLEELDMV